MSTSWYSITILDATGVNVVFNGYFSVNDETTIVTAFYETINGSTNFQNSILGPSQSPYPSYDYIADNTYSNNYWGPIGTNISSITLQSAYGFDTPYFNIYEANVLWSIIDLTTNVTITPVSNPGPVNPKIEYCAKKQSSTSSRMVSTCSSVQYNKLNTGGNDPAISKKMLYSQMVRSTNYKTGFFN